MRHTLPNATGPYHVGCTDIVTKYGEDRCLFRWYYPTEDKPSHATSPLWLGDNRYAQGFTDFLKIPRLSWLFKWTFSKALIPVVWNGKFHLPDEKRKLPVIIFSHGLGGNRLAYSGICLDLASQGALVASIEHADQSACTTFYYVKDDSEEKNLQKWIDFRHVASGSADEQSIRNEQVHHRADECVKLLDHIEEINSGTFHCISSGIDMSTFRDHVDLERCAIMGHSFGGATTITAISKDKRFKVGVGLDTWMFPLNNEIYKNVNAVPFLFINTEKFQWEANVAGMRKLDKDTFGVDVERRMLTLLGTVHSSQCDFALLVDNPLLSKIFQLKGAADAFHTNAVNNKLAFGFIGTHLGEDFGPSVDDVIKAHEDFVLVGSTIALDEERVVKSKEKLRSGEN
ncbi:platelet-activating factor acetylhydrolase-like [Clavelina lepadiformis]|uniref:1-alkyl-2-acetylglycerophosphocholine esterase n=1 Tax=Clavelina lepadiformis TaxID=159417 RepID=A0ABP0GI60_CLALP